MPSTRSTRTSFATESVTEAIAAYSLSTDFSNLPLDVVDRTKRIIADAISCIVMGSAMEPGQISRAYVEALGGAPISTIIGGGFRTAAPFAALVNGTSAHSDEMDGTHISLGHPAGTSVAGALAITEAASLGGKDLINAVVLAYDVGCRALVAMGGGHALRRERHVYGAALYALGIAAACGRLLSLQQLQVQHAMALSMLNVAAPASFYSERKHMSKALNSGQAAFAGVTGALLASHGFEAHDTVIEADHGIIDGWQTSEADLNLLTERLGSDFSVMEAGFKYYSAGYPIHGPLAGALSLMREHGLRADDITAVRVGLPPASAKTVDNPPMASICLQDMMGIGMVLGQLTYADAHDEAAFVRDDVRRLRSVIVVIPDESISIEDTRRRVSWVELDTRDGRTLQGPRRIPPGHWELGGMPWEDLHEKFDALVSPRFGDRNTNALWSVLTELEDQQDLGDLGELLLGQ